MQHVYPPDSAAPHTSFSATLHKMYTVNLRKRHKREGEGVLLFLSHHSQKTSTALQLPLQRTQKTPVHIRGQEENHQSQVGDATFTSLLALHTWDTFDIMLGHVVLWWSQRQVGTVKQRAHHEALPSDKQEGGRREALFLRLRLQEYSVHCNL